MNDYLASIIQGIVEGLTEFLPVSSTAHIILTQEILGVDRSESFWKMFAVFIQLGAILSVVVYFWRRIVAFSSSFLHALRTHDPKSKSVWISHPLPLVLISFVVTAVPCLLIDKFIGENLENLLVIGLALLIGGVAMFFIDRKFGKNATTHEIEQISIGQAIAIGLSQILAAAFPGTSRSMATIAGGQLMGLSRSAALEFSFFLSIPVMFAAAGYSLYKLLKDGFPSSHQWMVLGTGFVASFIVALMVIAWFMNWVRSRGFTPFAIYRALAGILVIAWWYFHRGV